jgi:hypothetical protein
MDQRLEKALEFSNYMITLGNQKRILKEQYQNNVIHYYNGGQFTVTQSLVSFCQSLLILHQAETVLIDDNDIPVQVEDLQTFASELVNVYAKAANIYLTEYNKLKKNRTVEGIVDL